MASRVGRRTPIRSHRTAKAEAAEESDATAPLLRDAMAEAEAAVAAGHMLTADQMAAVEAASPEKPALVLPPLGAKPSRPLLPTMAAEAVRTARPPEGDPLQTWKWARFDVESAIKQRHELVEQLLGHGGGGAPSPTGPLSAARQFLSQHGGRHVRAAAAAQQAIAAIGASGSPRRRRLRVAADGGGGSPHQPSPPPPRDAWATPAASRAELPPPSGGAPSPRRGWDDSTLLPPRSVAAESSLAHAVAFGTSASDRRLQQVGAAPEPPPKRVPVPPARVKAAPYGLPPVKGPWGRRAAVGAKAKVFGAELYRAFDAVNPG